MKKSNQEPFKALGARLKFLREQWQQSVDEVSGTLEIDEATLLAIESGTAMPPEELLDMLISHFLLTEDQAQDLRDLAADNRDQAEAFSEGLEDMLMKQIVMYLPVDNRVVYTDSMNATVNEHGVVLQFMQNTGQNNQQAAVSKVGMSREHAERMLKVLRDTLDQHDRSNGQKKLQAPDNHKEK
jgi:transcriptional regulator with XRE-family HTH domain